MKLIAEKNQEPCILYGVNGLRPNDPITARLHLLAPLLEAQDYIERVLPWDGQEITYDCTHFRRAGHPFGRTLATLQADWIGLKPDLKNPWLKVTPKPSAPIIINRTSRYQNPFFPWRELVETFDEFMAFIGHEYEHRAFCHDFGQVKYLPTKNLLEAAQLIAGSNLFIGNQSSCCAIAEGLKHRSIQETDLSQPDCIYPRENAIHCHDGALDFTCCGKHFTSKNKMFIWAHPNETPFGGWQVIIDGHHVNTYSFDLTFTEISNALRKAGQETPKNLKQIIIKQNSREHLDHPVARLKAQLYATSMDHIRCDCTRTP